MPAISVGSPSASRAASSRYTSAVGRRPTRASVYASFLERAGCDVVVGGLDPDVSRALQEYRGFIVVAAHRVDERTAQLDHGGPRSLLSPARSASATDRRKHSVPASTAPASTGASPASRRAFATARGGTPGRIGDCGACSAPQCRGRISTQLGPKHVGGRGDMTFCRIGHTGGHERLHEQDVRSFAEGSPAHRQLSQTRGPLVIAKRQCPQDGLAKLPVDHGRRALPLDQQPRLELRTRVRIDVQKKIAHIDAVQVAAGQFPHVDTGAGREVRDDWVARHRFCRTKRPLQLGQAPAQRTERIISPVFTPADGSPTQRAVSTTREIAAACRSDARQAAPGQGAPMACCPGCFGSDRRSRESRAAR